jgi:indole-3-glycerol phosphate synthase
MNKLAEIVAHKKLEVAGAKSQVSAVELEARLKDQPQTLGFYNALKKADGVGIIAEVKRASPSAGMIREENFDPVEIAQQYLQAGADCLSVLTDEKFFKGHLDYLRQIRQVSHKPLLRKDFFIDRYQVLEARIAGADAILLIAECLTDYEMQDLMDYADSLGLDTLLEIFEPDNLNRALAVSPKLLGINNRNLKNFETTLQQTVMLAPRVPAEILLVSESALKTRADIELVCQAGARGILVGETLMRSPDIAATVQEFRAGARSVRGL